MAAILAEKKKKTWKFCLKHIIMRTLSWVKLTIKTINWKHLVHFECAHCKTFHFIFHLQPEDATRGEGIVVRYKLNYAEDYPKPQNLDLKTNLINLTFISSLNVSPFCFSRVASTSFVSDII